MSEIRSLHTKRRRKTPVLCAVCNRHTTDSARPVCIECDTLLNKGRHFEEYYEDKTTTKLYAFPRDAIYRLQTADGWVTSKTSGKYQPWSTTDVLGALTQAIQERGRPSVRTPDIYVDVKNQQFRPNEEATFAFTGDYSFAQLEERVAEMIARLCWIAMHNRKYQYESGKQHGERFLVRLAEGDTSLKHINEVYDLGQEDE